MSEDLALSEMIRINLKNMLFQIHNKIYWKFHVLIFIYLYHYIVVLKPTLFLKQ